MKKLEKSRRERKKKASRDKSPLICLSSVESTAVDWLWPDRIPFGAVTVIGGTPKGGKSLLVARLAAIVSRGGSFPAGEGKAKVGHVVLLNPEDDMQAVLRPRLSAAKADLDRVHVLDASALKPRRILAKLRKSIDAVPETRLVVIDPATAFLEGGRNSADRVRKFLSRLSIFAQANNVAVVLVVHLNKSASSVSSGISGSFEWVAAARVVHLVAKDPNGSKRYLVCVANNLAPPPDAAVFTIQTKNKKAKIVWKKKTVKIDPEALLKPQSKMSATTASAVEFLKGAVKEPRHSAEILEEGKQLHFTTKEIHTAKARLGITSIRYGGLGGEGVWLWLPKGYKKKAVSEKDLKNLKIKADGKYSPQKKRYPKHLEGHMFGSEKWRNRDPHAQDFVSKADRKARSDSYST